MIDFIISAVLLSHNAFSSSSIPFAILISGDSSAPNENASPVVLTGVAS